MSTQDVNSLDPPDPLDDEIRAAFEALDTAALAELPAGYADDFAARLDAEIDAELAGEQDQAEAKKADHGHVAEGPGQRAQGDGARSDERAAARGAAADRDAAGDSGDQDETLDEIRALAQSAMKRISKERDAQESAREPSWSHSTALREVSLPASGPGLADDSAAMAASSARPEQSRRRTDLDVLEDEEGAGLPAWIYAAVAAVAATAVIFFVVRGGAIQEPTMAGDIEPVTPAASKASLEAFDDSPEPAAEAGKADEPARERDRTMAAERAGGSAKARVASHDEGVASADKPAARKLRSHDKPGAGDAIPPAKKARRKAGSKKNGKSAQEPWPEDKQSPEGGAQAYEIATSAAPEAPLERSRADVEGAMEGIAGKVRACGEKHERTGLVKTKFRVAPSGRVESAIVLGEPAKSDFARCVRDAVETVRLPDMDVPAARFRHIFSL